ncbi:hypothetical protein [Undibacterium sp. Ji22W]|uniref:hypothetical protein n=1 Tax=Undibacterium sp. Ji22W TaxID=3413038 RepID=UPI003BF0CF6E
MFPVQDVAPFDVVEIIFTIFDPDSVAELLLILYIFTDSSTTIRPVETGLPLTRHNIGGDLSGHFWTILKFAAMNGMVKCRETSASHFLLNAWIKMIEADLK